MVWWKYFYNQDRSLLFFIYFMLLYEGLEANYFVKDSRHTLSFNLNKFLPGWSYYYVNNGFLNGSAYDSYLTSDHILISNKTTAEPCVMVVSSDLYTQAFMKGEICLNISMTHSQILSSNFVLYLSKPVDQMISLNLVNFDNFLIQNIGCSNSNLGKKFIILRNNKKLLIKHNIFYHPMSWPLKCIIISKNEKGNKRMLNITIDFLNIFQPFLSRTKRSINPISFDKDKYDVTVKENLGKGTSFLKPKVTGGSMRYIFSKTRDFRTDKLFQIDEDSGELTVKGDLNQETGGTKFALDITAIDKENPKLIAQSTVFVTIKDVNDNAPVFKSPKYTKDIDEEEPAGKFVLTIQATDNDQGINQKIKYSIVKDLSSIDCPFEIDSESGVVTNSKKLDREEKGFYTFKVKAEDKGIDPGPLSSEVVVEITLNDINDNNPIFEQKNYSVEIFENTTAQSIIAKITATDKDIGSNGNIFYQPLNNKKFVIDPVTGEIKLQEMVDYDIGDERDFMFTVVAFDQGKTPNFANAQVKVILYFCLAFYFNMFVVSHGILYLHCKK